MPEETDFGQLLAGSGLAEANSSQPQQSADLQFTADLDDQHPTRRPQAKSSRPISHPVVREQHSNNDQRGAATAHATGGRLSKFDENAADYARPGVPDQQLATAIPVQAGGHEAYDALSTEPTPSQVRNTEASGYSSSNHHQHHNHHHHHAQTHSPNGRHFLGSRRHLNRTSSNANQITDDGQLAVMQSPYHDALGDPADLIDDIHTTRSSLANSQSEGYHNKGSNSGSGAQANQIPLSLQAPYGATPANSMNQLNQILMHSSNGKLDPSSSLLDADDLMGGPYSRLHSTSSTNNGSSNSLADAILRDYNLASAIGNASSSQSANQLLNSAMLTNLIGAPGADGSSETDPFSQAQQQQSPQQPPTSATAPNNHHHRGYPSAWPISVLLSDLLKLTARPAQQLSNALTGGNGGGDQSNRGSILQQSRLPGPLLSLLQGFAPGSGGSNHELGLANHDASESSQHYHRVSMSPTDIHSILARSLGSSNVLPAFPPPKGTPQSWIPPTQGGSVDYSSAATRNADLIASNVAGFVRNAGNQQLLNSANDQSSHQFNPQQHEGYQRSSNDGTFFAQTPDNSQVNGLQSQQTQANFGGGVMEQQMAPIDQTHHASHQQGMFPPISQQISSNTDRSWSSNQAPSGGAAPATFALGASRQAGAGQPSNDMDNRQANNFKQASPQSTLLSQQDYNNYMNFHQAHNLAAQPGSGAASAPLFNLVPNNINANNGQQQVAPQHKLTAPQGVYNQAQMYSNNNNQPPSEMPVPLGYNSPLNGAGLSSQSQIAAQPRSFEHTNVESSVPKISLPNNAQSSSPSLAIVNKQQVVQSRHLGKQVMNHQQNQLVPGPAKAHVLARRKRAVVSHTREDMGREDEVMSSKYNANDDEDDGDSRPISVVRPDGRPMNSGRVRGYLALANQGGLDEDSSTPAANDRQVAQSQRNANHLDLKPRSPSERHYLSSLYGNQNDLLQKSSRSRQQNTEHDRDNMILNESGNFMEQRDRPNDKGSKRATNLSKQDHKNSLDTAGSGLMSKLLSTASTNDEMEDDMDDDEDPASEKRKEELEDAEFGIVNDERQNRPSSDGPSSNGQSLDNGKSSMRPVEAGNSGSGTTDNEAYVRRHQQRSDIEFYGHPGEETRQLKYGILGSGNYEVVNGGIYPEADESTAAVNSVANYVRKPILGNLPKLLGGEPVNPQAAFMPGGRVGGFLRGASTPSDELVGMMPGDIGKHLANPLLELIDANSGEQLFDPNLLAQLGSSGSSARTTHASRETGNSQSTDEEQIESDDAPDRKQRDSQKESKISAQDGRINPTDYKRSKKGRKKMIEKDHQDDGSEASIDETDDNSEDQSRSRTSKNSNREPNELNSSRLDRQQSSVSGSRSQGTNQFNSYQILPSKKVTIFSDQDLDSAPSERHLGAQTYQLPRANEINRLQPSRQKV